MCTASGIKTGIHCPKAAVSKVWDVTSSSGGVGEGTKFYEEVIL